jgi:hypothetical protein
MLFDSNITAFWLSYTNSSAGECGVPYAMRFTGGHHPSSIVKGGVDPASLCVISLNVHALTAARPNAPAST